MRVIAAADSAAFWRLL